MKTIVSIIIAGLLILKPINTLAQHNKNRYILGVISIDSKGINMENILAADLVRMELEKLDTFSVTDKYDVLQTMDRGNWSPSNCFGKLCLVEIGRQLKCDKMFTGSVERLGKSIVITYRLLNVMDGIIEKTYVHEFLNIPDEIQNMVKLSVAEMFGKPYDTNLMQKLSKKNDFDNVNNNPATNYLRLDGPRMGFVSYTGQVLKIMMDKKSKGGFDVFPFMFQFGYQFEKQYLNEGKVQALFEFIPMITGLDQGYFIPSASLLHGIRSNINGWELAFGPTFNILPTSSGYFDGNNEWQVSETWDKANKGKPNPYEIKRRLDSRGTYELQSAFVFAAGRTFKSGKLNIPINVYVVPGKDGWRYGFSVGFNAKNN